MAWFLLSGFIVSILCSYLINLSWKKGWNGYFNSQKCCEKRNIPPDFEGAVITKMQELEFSSMDCLEINYFDFFTVSLMSKIIVGTNNIFID